ncbi:MAG TPA: protein kinase [Kofleriaceae bacterium]|nr:protein kinase [Kofleriaceae bacterium]
MRPELDETQTAALDETATQDKSPALDKTATARAKEAPPPAGADLAEGVRLGHFRIERKLGAGGMGEVYLATDLALDRPVAIKVLPSGTASGKARERLIKEARAQARVNHTNVAHIYFIGEEEGRLYFAMEYVTGKTLAERIAAGPLPVEDALAVIRAATLGLREAQRSGFTHRDVKPSNLMVDGHGVVKVLDFGLAAGSPGSVTDGPVAQTTLAGTPLYMAPEQARGEAIDFRADIYALGATLFHLVSGHPPFIADSVDELLTLHASAARPLVPRGDNPRTTIKAIGSLIARMMAPNPADRFASYDELLRALELASVEQARPAGIWVRGIAAFLDFLLVLIVLGLVEGLVELIHTPGDFVRGPVVLVTTYIYSALAIGRWGTTAGKGLFELQVVSVTTGDRPTWRQAIRRQLIAATLPLAFTVGDEAFGALHFAWPAFICRILLGLTAVYYFFAMMHSSLRVPGKRAPWDRMSGTMVRYRTTRGSTGAAA